MPRSNYASGFLCWGKRVNPTKPKQNPILYEEGWGELVTLQFILDSETIWFLP